MNLETKNANDLISKDYKVSKAAACAVIEERDIKTFSKLCEKSDFLFDFIKEKIIKNLTEAVTPENLQNIFDFTKIYNADFEDFIVNSLIKYANEDLTDEILELYETGTDEQKAYASAYFFRINDPVCVEYLEKYAFSDFEPLAQNSAKALSKFEESALFENSKQALLNPEIDDIEKCKYINFLVSYGKKEAFGALYEFFKETFIKSYTASSILYLLSLKDLIQSGKQNEALEIFDSIIEAYPEEISLDTVFDFEIFDFIKYITDEISKNNLPYLKRLILKAKSKFNLISGEDIYTFDLSNDTKKEIQRISDYINTLNINLFEGLQNELHNENPKRVLETLYVILNFGKTELSEEVLTLLQNSKNEEIILEASKTLKSLNKLSLINKEEVLSKLHNETIKAMAQALFEA